MMNRFTKYIFDNIFEISNTELQRKLWLNEDNDTGLMSSYIELMCSLFDDNAFDLFIDEVALRIGFSMDIIYELDKLRELLNKYEGGEFDKEIIDNIDWLNIVKQAKIVVNMWNAIPKKVLEKEWTG